jgi:hypothetical protein
MIIRVVTITGKMNTCKKYILVTAAPDREVPPNISVATQLPMSGVDFAIAIPIVAAPKARASQGSK